MTANTHTHTHTHAHTHTHTHTHIHTHTHTHTHTHAHTHTHIPTQPPPPVCVCVCVRVLCVCVCVYSPLSTMSTTKTVTSTAVAVIADTTVIQPINWPLPREESINRLNGAVLEVGRPEIMPYLLLKLQEISKKQDDGEIFDPAGEECQFTPVSLKALSGSPDVQQHIRMHETPDAFKLCPDSIQAILLMQTNNKKWKHLVVDFDSDVARKAKRKLLYTADDNEEAAMADIMAAAKEFLPVDPAQFDTKGYMPASDVQENLWDQLTNLRSCDVLQCTADEKNANEGPMLVFANAVVNAMSALRHGIVENNVLVQLLSRQTTTSIADHQQSRIAQMASWMHELPAEVLDVNTPKHEIVALGTVSFPFVLHVCLCTGRTLLNIC